MTTHDNAAPPLGWKVERRYPHCPGCLLACNICGCPDGEQLTRQAQAAWLDR